MGEEEEDGIRRKNKNSTQMWGIRIFLSFGGCLYNGNSVSITVGIWYELDLKWKLKRYGLHRNLILKPTFNRALVGVGF